MIGLEMMNTKILSFLILFFGCQGVCDYALADSSETKPVKLEGMGYYSARKVILSYGWSAAPGPCEQISHNTCARFPEIGSCSGVGPGYCGMVFVKQNRCLYVVTTGGEPESDGDGDARVKKITFRGGPCSKN